jgi:hypothetical protein
MPNYYKFSPQKCNEDKNFRNNSIAGCKYESKPSPFNPQTRTRGQVKPILPPTIPPTNLPKPTAPPTNLPKPQPLTPQPLTPQPPVPITPKPQPSSNNNKEKDNLQTTANVRPLKKVDTLTPEKIAKGKMVAAAYEMVKDFPGDNSFDSLMTMNQEDRNRLLMLRARNTDRFLSDNGINNYSVVSDLTTSRDAIVLLGRGSERRNIKIVLKGMTGDKYASEVQRRNEVIRGQTEDMSRFDKLYETINSEFPNHNIEIISYSLGGHRGMYLADKYKLPHYSIDPLLGPQEVKALTMRGSDAPPLEMVRTIKPAIAMGSGQTIAEIIGGTPKNTTITQIEPLAKNANLNSITRLPADHMAENYNTTLERTKTGVIGKGAVGSVVAGVVPIALASYITDQVNPDANKAVKIAETSIGGAVLTKGISPLVGAGAVSASGLVAPIAGSLIAAEGAGELANVILPEEMETHSRQTLQGAFAGAGGGLGYVGTQAAGTSLLSAGSNIAARAAGYSALAGEEAAAGVEMAEIGAGAVEAGALEAGALEAGALATEGGIEAALVGATEALGVTAAAEGGLNPIADAAFLAVGTGAIIGGVAGLIGSVFNQDNTNNDEERKKRLFMALHEGMSREEWNAELSRVAAIPKAPKGSLLIDLIQNDEEYNQHFESGDTQKINNRIRQIVIENKYNHHNAMDVINGFDDYPQIKEDGTWAFKKWTNDDVDDVWRETPHPNTSKQHTPIVKPPVNTPQNVQVD